MADVELTKLQDQSERVRDVLRKLQGVVFTLDAMADQRYENANALRNVAREVDRAYATLDDVADEIVKADGTVA